MTTERKRMGVKGWVGIVVEIDVDAADRDQAEQVWWNLADDERVAAIQEAAAEGAIIKMERPGWA